MFAKYVIAAVVALLCLQGTFAQDAEEECTCVYYYNCSPTPIVPGGGGGNGGGSNGGSQIEDGGNGGGEGQSHGGENLIDIRGSTNCDHYLQTCCPPNRIITTDEITPAPPTNGGGGSTGTTESSVDHGSTGGSVGCGFRNVNGLNYELTGNTHGEAQIGEFPWMVAIEVSRDYGTSWVYQCGGSLISLEVVLTAAHCVAGLQSSELKIRAGEWDTQTTNEQFPYQERSVKHFVAHERYYAAALHNDVALIFLESPVEPLSNIGTICLPIQGDTFDHTRCFATGWGKDVYGKEGVWQAILKKLELPVVPRNQCERSLRQTRLGKLFKLHESFICAGGEAGIDTCSGDGGSPLVCALTSNPHHYQQAGIVAWGIGCGVTNIPGVYTNVAHFRNWIDDRMQDSNVDSSTYVFPGQEVF